MTPKKAYDDQLRHASERDIEWGFTYSEWLEMWLVSGEWFKRGKKLGHYQMCRYGDTGSYNTKNCFIGLVEQNQEDKSKYPIEIVNKAVFEYLNTDKSQYEVANEFGLDQPYVSKIVNQHRRKYGQNNSTSS